MARKKSKLSIIMFSGTADKFLPLGILSQAATAMGFEVNIFVTGWALLSFTKNAKEPPFPNEFKDMAPALLNGLKKMNAKPWQEMLKEAKSMGAKVYVCSTMAGVMGLKKEDMNELVDDIVGAATFLEKADGGETLFI
ncbi:MAG: DsrE/DsrF/DrsH-like family protein [Candidatus Micrarchaeia archaeon]|jgi:peroxiredoxin family protein